MLPGPLFRQPSLSGQKSVRGDTGMMTVPHNSGAVRDSLPVRLHPLPRARFHALPVHSSVPIDVFRIRSHWKKLAFSLLLYLSSLRDFRQPAYILSTEAFDKRMSFHCMSSYAFSPSFLDLVRRMSPRDICGRVSILRYSHLLDLRTSEDSYTTNKPLRPCHSNKLRSQS